jgi:hypothetical protein
MQSSLAYRPSLPVLSFPTPWNEVSSLSHSAFSGATDAISVNLAPDATVEASTAGTGLFTVGPRTYGSVFRGAGNANYSLFNTVVSISLQSFPTVSSGLVYTQQFQVIESVDLDEPKRGADTSFVRDAHWKKLPLWKKIQDITATVPAEVWESVPGDLASNVDKYLYHKDDTR